MGELTSVQAFVVKNFPTKSEQGGSCFTLLEN